MQRYHSSLISYIKGRPDFRAKGLEREIEREREREREGETETETGTERETERQTDRQRERGEREGERERERERESAAADRNSFTIFFINAIKQKRPFYRCFG